MPTEKDKVFWTALHTVLDEALSDLPSSIAPRVIPFPYEGEEWKEQAQVDDAESDNWSETEEMIRYFCQHHHWPNPAKGEACYFAGERIRWARTFTRWLTLPSSKTGNVFFRRPKESGFELLEWLLIDVYAVRTPPAPPTPFYISTPEGMRKITPN